MRYILLIILSLYMTSQKSIDYKKIHSEAVVVDGHNDVVHRIISGENLAERTSNGHIDLIRMKEGGVDVAFFSVWVPPEQKSPSYFKQADRQVNALLSFAKENPEKIQLALHPDDIKKYNRKSKIAMLISMEGAHPIGNNPDKLDYFYRMGVRSVMPTWNNSTDWATSASDESKKTLKSGRKGLTELGKKFIRRMDKLGIIIDVSHSGEQTFWDIVRTSKNPIIASHSCVWNICRHIRNLKDEQIKAIAKSGGVIGINFAPSFLDSTFKDKEIELRDKYKTRIDSIKNNWSGDALSREAAISDMLKPQYESIIPKVTTLVDHIDYIVKLVGVNYVGLGSDFDGISVTPKELKDVSCYPLITKELLARGFNEKDIKKILGGNFLRVIRKVLK